MATPNARDPSNGSGVSDQLCLGAMEAGRVCRTTHGPVSELVSQHSSQGGGGYGQTEGKS